MTVLETIARARDAQDKNARDFRGQLAFAALGAAEPRLEPDPVESGPASARRGLTAAGPSVAPNASKRAPSPKHACALCGRKQPADRMVYSRFTRNRYCRDDKACQRRRKRARA